MSNLVQRLISAAVLIPLLLVIIYDAPAWVFMAAVVAAAVLSAWELLRMACRRDALLQLLGAAATAVLVLQLRYETEAMGTMTIVAAVLVATALLSVLRLGKDPALFRQTGWVVATPVYLGFPLAALALLQLLDPGWVVLAMAFAFAGDTLAYAAGRLWGRRKLMPLVSPKKTVEGAFGGLAGSVLAAVVGHYWFVPQLDLVHGIALGVVAGVAGQAGDLFESMAKRSFEVKDSSQLIPGHGGMLDRIDALLMTSLITWLYVYRMIPHG